MNDTTPEAAAAFDALMERRSGGERVRMACEMFDMARKLVIAGILADDPTIAPLELRRRLFERFYGDDFSPAERARIIASLR